jgi:Tfp pilus assembly protein PilO
MEIFQDKRVWLGGGALVAVLLAVVSWFVVISPELSSASSLRAQTSDAELQNAVTQSKVTKLRLQSEQVGQLRSALAAALEALPSPAGCPRSPASSTRRPSTTMSR